MKLYLSTVILYRIHSNFFQHVQRTTLTTQQQLQQRRLVRSSSHVSRDHIGISLSANAFLLKRNAFKRHVVIDMSGCKRCVNAFAHQCTAKRAQFMDLTVIACQLVPVSNALAATFQTTMDAIVNAHWAKPNVPDHWDIWTTTFANADAILATLRGPAQKAKSSIGIFATVLPIPTTRQRLWVRQLSQSAVQAASRENLKVALVRAHQVRVATSLEIKDVTRSSNYLRFETQQSAI